MNSTCLVRAASSATAGSSGSSASSVRRSAAGCSRISAAIRVARRGGGRDHGSTRSAAGRLGPPRRRPPPRAAVPYASRPASQVARAERSSPSQTRSAVRAGLDPAEVGPAEDVGRQPGRRVDGGAQVDAGGDHVGDGRVQPQPGAGDRAVGPAGQAERVDRDLLAAEVVRPRRHAGGRDRVGDEHDPARRRRRTRAGRPARRRGAGRRSARRSAAGRRGPARPRPGSRWCSGRIALNRWVTSRAPASAAASA